MGENEFIRLSKGSLAHRLGPLGELVNVPSGAIIELLGDTNFWNIFGWKGVRYYSEAKPIGKTVRSLK